MVYDDNLSSGNVEHGHHIETQLIEQPGQRPFNIVRATNPRQEIDFQLTAHHTGTVTVRDAAGKPLFEIWADKIVMYPAHIAQRTIITRLPQRQVPRTLSHRRGNS